MRPPPFAYAPAWSLDEALRLLGEAGDDAKLLAGGQSLIPQLACRLARPTHLVDIGRLPGVTGLRAVGGGLRIGALTRHIDVERSVDLAGPWQALREAAGLIGHYPIRVRGTFGGALAHADPAAEFPVVAAALQAAFAVRSSTGERVIPAGDFFTGPFTTVLEPTEMLVEARFPAPPDGLRSVFEEFAPRAGDFAFASAAVALAPDAHGRARHVRIALGSVGPVPQRADDAEAALEDSALTDQEIADAAQLASDACEPAGDCHAGSTFRRELVAVLVTRALRRLRVMH